MANIENLFTLLTKQSSIITTFTNTALQVKKGKIEFKQLSFYYRADRSILQDVSFDIEPGQKVAVVGESGAGKSTLVKLLFRFYDPTQGQILIDGQDISRVDPHSLRRAIGIVPQDTVLFNDSIFENIRYGRPQASNQEVQQAIELAHLQDFIQSLPDGHNTQVGERGLKLSGGEKQRVAIARTILKRPPIMVFDEATSSLDSQSEQSILNSLREIAQGHTSLVIAHRLSTIVDADKIVVMGEGRIIEQGTHEQLLILNGAYSVLWHTQQRSRLQSNIHE